MNYEFGIRNEYKCTGVTCVATGDGRISEIGPPESWLPSPFPVTYMQTVVCAIERCLAQKLITDN